MNQGILTYAPIFWFHEDEHYFPIDVKSVIENANLYLDGKEAPFGRKVEDLVGLEKNGEEYWLELPDIDFQLSIKNKKKIQSKKGYGLRYVSDSIRELYSELKEKYKRVIYTRYSRFDIASDDISADAYSPKFGLRKDILVGTYDVYQYFPFYIFNDFTNLHIGDWDSTVEIFVNRTSNIKWVRTHSHNYSWIAKMGQYQSISNWLIPWNDGNFESQSIYNINLQPFIFVSKGGHGCYPTPGYSIRGIGLIDLPIAFEEREIGKTCLIPKLENKIDRDKIIKRLKQSNIQSKKLKFMEYELIDFDSEPWSKFSGHWGNRSELETWDSPISAPFKRRFKINKRNFIKLFNELYKKDRKTELIFHNYHGILEK